MEKHLRQIIAEINQKTTKELMIAALLGILSILWPLCGFVIFILCSKTKYVLCGKIALMSSLVVIVCFIFKTLVTTLI